jgi:hypothetical protein
MTLQVIGTKVRMLVGAVVIAAALAAVAAAPASAEPPRKDTWVRCSMWNPRLAQYDFYLEGESFELTGPDGQKHALQCGSDGQWHLVWRTTTGVIAPTPSSATTAASGGSKPVTGRRGR